MRTIHEYTLTQESAEAQRKAQRYNPATEMNYRDKAGKHTVTLGAGTSDTIHVFRDGPRTYVLTVNYGLPYVGLDVYENGETVGDVFLQEDNCTETLGTRWEDWTPIYLCKVLANYLPY